MIYFKKIPKKLDKYIKDKNEIKYKKQDINVKKKLRLSSF